jgi:hypothetical protein
MTKALSPWRSSEATSTAILCNGHSACCMRVPRKRPGVLCKNAKCHITTAIEPWSSMPAPLLRNQTLDAGSPDMASPNRSRITMTSCLFLSAGVDRNP